MTAAIEFTTEAVGPSGFVGRVQEAELVLLRACAPAPPLQSLEGASKIGRTSMLRHLQARWTSRSQEGGARFIAPLLDLTPTRGENPNARTQLLTGIVDALADSGIDVGELPDNLAATTVVALAMEKAVEAGDNLLLLVDRTEYLLTRRGDGPAAAEWSRSAMDTLGELNERVPMATVLAFGSTGPASKLSAVARRLHLLQALEDLSQLFNRGNLTRTTLGPLNDEEIRGYARRASIRGLDGQRYRATKTDLDWIVDLAGGHPLVMQLAGIRLFEAKALGDTRAEREYLAAQIADPGLQSFIYDAFERIGQPDPDSMATLRMLLDGGEVELPPDLLGSLVEEGLAQAVSERVATMPSRALRMALDVYLERLAAASPAMPAEVTSAPPTQPADGPRVAGPSLARADDGGRSVRLTRSEHAIMAALLARADTVTREELKAALGPNAGDHQLNQRISVLRSKINEQLDAPDAIVSVYGEGYRVATPELFVLTA
jgi:hypothetical protein